KLCRLADLIWSRPMVVHVLSACGATPRGLLAIRCRTIFGAREPKATRFSVHGRRLRAVRAVDVSEPPGVGVPGRVGCGGRAVPHLSGPRARHPRLAADPAGVRRRSRDRVGRGPGSGARPSRDREPHRRDPAAIGGLFAAGGSLLYATAHPFLESMLAVAALLGFGQFFLVQWVAPFLSEFPEMVSTLGWARRVTRAPMALMNLVSSNINQWTVLAAMIPLVYGYSSLHHHGAWRDFRFDDAQRLEVLLTLLQ